MHLEFVNHYECSRYEYLDEIRVKILGKARLIAFFLFKIYVSLNHQMTSVN